MQNAENVIFRQIVAFCVFKQAFLKKEKSKKYKSEKQIPLIKLEFSLL